MIFQQILRFLKINNNNKGSLNYCGLRGWAVSVVCPIVLWGVGSIPASAIGTFCQEISWLCDWTMLVCFLVLSNSLFSLMAEHGVPVFLFAS